MLVCNKHLEKVMSCSVFCDLNPTGQRNVACNCSSNCKIVMSIAVRKKCISSLGTEDQYLSVLRNDGLNFKLSEICLVTFHVKFLAILNKMEQNKRDSV
jgi:hypothetical protein